MEPPRDANPQQITILAIVASLHWDLRGNLAHVPSQNDPLFSFKRADGTYGRTEFIGSMPTVNDGYLEEAAVALFSHFDHKKAIHARIIHSNVCVNLGYYQPFNHLLAHPDVLTGGIILTLMDWVKLIVSKIPIHRDVFINMVRMRIPLPVDYIATRSPNPQSYFNKMLEFSDPYHTQQAPMTHDIEDGAVEEAKKRWEHTTMSAAFLQLKPHVRQLYKRFPPYKFYTDKMTMKGMFRVYTVLSDPNDDTADLRLGVVAANPVVNTVVVGGKSPEDLVECDRYTDDVIQMRVLNPTVRAFFLHPFGWTQFQDWAHPPMQGPPPPAMQTVPEDSSDNEE